MSTFIHQLKHINESKERSQMMKSTTVSLCIAAAWSLAVPAQAQNLVSLFSTAKNYDATYQSALAQYEANRYKANQTVAGILPNVNFSASSTRSLLDYTPDNFFVNPVDHSKDVIPFMRYYGTHVASLTAVQPLYRPANYDVYLQGKKQLAQTVTQLVASEQDLLIRLSQAYFDVLSSSDSLKSIKAQKQAVAEQLASAKRNFEVGTATITDTREAEARYDLILAQEIAGDNDLRIKKLFLDQLVGSKNVQPSALKKNTTFENTEPKDIDAWVALTEQAHPSVLNAQLALDIATLEVDRAKSAHRPTLDLQIGMSGTRNQDGTATSGTSSLGTHVLNKSVALLMNLPLYQGYATQNRVLETIELENKARYDLEGAKRATAQSTRSAFYNLVSGLGQVKALNAAERSSLLALQANQLGYTVGVRINIDVLNSQSQLYQTQRDLAKAKYDVLVGGLKLKQANGTLKPEDLQSLNALLDE